MKTPSWIRRLLFVDDSVLDKQFSLEASDQPGGSPESNGPQAVEGTHDLLPRSVTRPIPMEELLRDKDADGPLDAGHGARDEHVSASLNRNKEMVNEIFFLPDNADVYVRDFTIGVNHAWRAFAVFVDGLSDKNIINTHILEPLMVLTHLIEDDVSRRTDTVREALLPGNQVDYKSDWKDIIAQILAGSTAVFIEGCDKCLIVETKGWEHRTVGTAQTEVVVRGPHDAFTESFRANTGLVRARFRSERLVTEMLSVGELGKTDIGVMYVKGLTNPRLVDEVKRRIKAIKVDYLADSGILEQFLEDDPNALVPQLMSTERPDRVAHMLTEGHVAIFVGQSPFVLTVPVVLWTLVQTSEDAYLRFPFGTFLRCIRWVALVTSVLLPGFYISVTNFHPEMIPTDLMLAIAGSREQVPFPVVAEVLLMEFAIELIREAGIRIPSVIGPTIGIVGALIIGQAAVQAGVVSPLLVIVIATTALASFAIPNYNLSMATRIWRFVFLVSAALFGFYGMTLMICAAAAKLAVQKSFGVPFLAPVAPSMDASPDVFMRGHAFAMNQRPTFLQTGKSWRQKPWTRPWSAKTDPKGDKNGGDSQ